VFDHVGIRVADRAASERFYTTVLAALGIEPSHIGGVYAEWNDFSLAAVDDAHPPTRGLHVAFVAPTRAHVDSAWRAGVDAGHPDEGAPGPRPQYRSDYYGAFLLDPDGNSVEAVHHGAIRPPGHIDHLWIRVADPAASERFYATIAPYAGLRRGPDRDHVMFVGAGGSFSLVPGSPATENVHLAFGADDDTTVGAFHRAAVEAGYRDHGRPGERPEYHPGYYAAYVLDPDANNVEVVNHHR
jgi:catechol 2,3-dioxygenase-like lactoylglutathione lyase family enzyme